MSRVGKNPVTVPNGVEVKIATDHILAKGKLGQRTMSIDTDLVSVALDNGKISVTPKSPHKRARTMWGTTRALINNLVQGVSEGFTVKMEMTGVGYRAQVQGKDLHLQLGFSHDVIYPIPEGVTVVCEKPTAIVLNGPNKQALGQMAAEIRAYRPPEPYKGKGIAFEGEQILRKEGKKK